MRQKSQLRFKDNREQGPDLRQRCGDAADAERQQQRRGGSEASQRLPRTGLEVAAYVKQTVQDSEAHVKAVCQYEAHGTGPPRQHVGQEQEGHGQSQHHQIIPKKIEQVWTSLGANRMCLTLTWTSVFLLVYLVLAHSSKYKALCYTVDGEQEDVAAVASQQTRAFHKYST